MSNYINDLNDLITAKSEIKNIIQDTLNENPSEVFSYYPSYIARIAASSEGPYVISYSYLSENYPDFTYLYAYVADAVESGGGSVDLSSYVTYAYLASKNYVDYNAFNALENEVYLDEDDGGSGTFKASLKDVLEESGLIYEADADVYDVMDIHQHIDDTVKDWLNLSSYVTKTELSTQSYATTTDLNNYLPISGGTLSGNLVPSQSASFNLGSSSSRWKEIRSKSTYTDTAYLQDTSYSSNIVPKETASYTLGDSTYFYANSYVSDMWTGAKNKFSNRSDNQVNLMLNNGWKYTFHTNGFSPANNNQDLGNVNPWRSTYSTNLYTNTAYLQDTSYTKSIVPAENAAYTLGDANNFYNAAYTTGLFIHPNNGWVNVSNWQTKFRIDNADKYYLTSNRFYPYINGACNLGLSTNKWGSTYTTDLYADNIHNFIWTGTSAEYAALDNYTTYQIYMIKES